MIPQAALSKEVIENYFETSVKRRVRPLIEVSGLFSSLEEPVNNYQKILLRLKELASQRKYLIEVLKERVNVGKVKRKNSKGVFAGVDTGVSGLNLVSGFLPSIKAVGVVFKDFKLIREPLVITFLNNDIWVTEKFPKLRAGLLGFYFQFKLAKKLIEECKPDILFFDGSLLINNVYYPNKIYSSVDYLELFKETVSSAVSLIKECEERNIGLIGFIKRCRSTHYSKKLLSEIPFTSKGFHRVAVPDVSLLNPVLKKGEYTPPFKVRGLMSNVYKGKSVGERGAANIYAFYIKTVENKVYRVEFPSYLLKSFNKIVSSLIGVSDPLTGLPYPIYEADALSKLTDEAVSTGYLSLYSELINEIEEGNFSLKDLDLLDLHFGEKVRGENVDETDRKNPFRLHNR